MLVAKTLCYCGHAERYHGNPSGDFMRDLFACWECWRETDMRSTNEKWLHEFRIDNLVYIERLYDASR